MNNTDGNEYAKDVAVINKISIVPNILDVVSRITKMGFVAIASVTEDKWIACAVKDDISFGLKPGGELVLETTICNEIRQHNQPVIIDEVRSDEMFRNHHTPAKYGFQSYISMPIIKRDGSFFGTLCAIDPNPNKLRTPEIIGMFNLFADLISHHLEAAEELSMAETKLTEEQGISELREQFIAVLGHDLKNPLSAITMGVEVLEMSPNFSAENSSVTKIIKGSIGRIKGLINNVLDFAKGKMGGGIQLNSALTVSLEKTLNHVIEELRLQFPNKEIQSSIEIEQAVSCDEMRLAQLVSNLIANAIIHGVSDTTVDVVAFSSDDRFILSVSNYAANVSHSFKENVFQPFYRGNDKTGKKGLGLGLYIAQEIAKAHHGELTVSQQNDKVLFKLEMPLN